MRRLGYALSASLFAPALFAADEANATASKLSPGLETALLWVNFAILAAVLVHLIRKYGAPYYASRSEHIQREIVEAAKIRKEAEATSADVDRRLANLETDLAALRAESQRELESLDRQHGEKIAAEMARIQANAEQEIAAAGKAARLELKRYSAELAVQLAVEKIRARMTPGAEESLVRDFIQELDRSHARAQAN